MAKPRVFISSTYYDLKHLRSSLENFVENLGYEPVLSEKDDIAYVPDVPLDESCYREARSSDIYVLIIGGRYGSKANGTNEAEEESELESGFYQRYESITKQEYQNACDRNIPSYVLIESSVDAEYQTWLRNRKKKDIEYAHVDSVNIFHFIEHIRDQQKNNPIKTFSRYSEIESWLKEQWAGFFRELIHRMGAQHQIEDLDGKINDLSETSETLKRYLETVVSQVSKEKESATQIISKENERLKQAKVEAEFLGIGYIRHLNRTHDLPTSAIRDSLVAARSYERFMLTTFAEPANIPRCALSLKAFSEVNEAREYLEKSIYPHSQLEKFRDKYEEEIKGPSTKPVAKRKKPARKSKSEKPGKSDL